MRKSVGFSQREEGQEAHEKTLEEHKKTREESNKIRETREKAREIYASIRAGDLEQAEIDLTNIPEADRNSPDVLRVMSLLRLKQESWAEAARVYRALASDHPEVPVYQSGAYVAEALAAIEKGDLRAAMELAVEAARLRPERAGFLARPLWRHLQDAAFPADEMRVFFKKLAKLAPKDKSVVEFRRRARRLADLSDAASLAGVSDAASNDQDTRKARRRARRLARSNDWNDRQAGHHRGMAAFAAQEWAIAHKELPRDATDPMAIRRLKLLDRLADIGALEANPEFVRELYERGLVVREKPGARTSLFVFGGVVGGRRIGMLEPFLRNVDAHVIFLADRRNLVFATGIDQLGSTVEATVEALAQLNTSLGSRRMVTLGHSAGGYAAVRYALALRAESALTFSAPTTFDESYLGADGRGRAVFSRIRRYASERMVDLCPLLEAHTPPLKLVCVFGGSMPRDRWHAERLSSVPGVFLYEMQALDSHDSIIEALGTGLFNELLQPLLAGDDLTNRTASLRARGTI